MATTIYFLRHGKLVNPDKLVKGRLPFPLNDIGRSQIHKAAAFFTSRTITAIYSSSLLRCRQSAKILKEYFPKVKIHFSELLVEWGTEVAGQPCKLYENLSFPHLKECYETPDSVVSRMRKFCRKIVEKCPNQEVVAIGHGGPINALRVSFEGRLVKSTTSGPFKEGTILKLVLSSDLDLLDSEIINVSDLH